MSQSSTYSNHTSSAAVYGGHGRITGMVLTAGSDAATATLYDNTAGSGTIIAKLGAATGESVVVPIPEGGVSFGKGVYATLTGTSPSFTLFYIAG